MYNVTLKNILCVLFINIIHIYSHQVSFKCFNILNYLLTFLLSIIMRILIFISRVDLMQTTKYTFSVGKEYFGQRV